MFRESGYERDYHDEVKKEHQRLVEEGAATPWDAWERAHRIVQKKRQKKAQEKFLKGFSIPS